MYFGGDSTAARLFWAVGVPAVAAVLVVGARLLAAHGPDLLAATAPGQVLLTLIGFAGYGVAVFSQLRYFNVIVFLGAFLALVTGLSLVAGAVTEDALRQRGEVTSCTVTAVTPVSVTSTDTDGHTRTTIRFVNELQCADPAVTTMATDGRVAGPGDRIDVLHDPWRRLDPRPAGNVEAPWSRWLQGLLLLGLGAGLRLLYEYGVWPFRLQW